MSAEKSYAQILKASSIMGGAAGINLLLSMIRTKFVAVLIGTTGRNGNVLKLRPPLAFTSEHIPTLVAALDAALTETAPA